MHASDALAPIAVEYVPAPQSEHVEKPPVRVYWPAPHKLQLALLVTPLPVENLPAVQAVQPDTPVLAPYLPAGQAPHAVAVFPYPNPPDQQARQAVLPWVSK